MKRLKVGNKVIKTQFSNKSLLQIKANKLYVLENLYVCLFKASNPTKEKNKTSKILTTK